LELTKDLLERLIKEGKGLEEIEAITGQSKYKVKKAVVANGLKTARMQHSGQLNTLELMKVYNKIVGGKKTVEELTSGAGLDAVPKEVAEAAVRKLLADGAVRYVLEAVPV
jgi:hypothetical protein